MSENTKKMLRMELANSVALSLIDGISNIHIEKGTNQNGGINWICRKLKYHVLRFHMGQKKINVGEYYEEEIK